MVQKYTFWGNEEGFLQNLCPFFQKIFPQRSPDGLFQQKVIENQCFRSSFIVRGVCRSFTETLLSALFSAFSGIVFQYFVQLFPIG